MNIIKTDGIDIYSWCPTIEENALNDAKNVAKQPYVKWYALMPDAHGGSAAPIGSVIACENVVVPWAVGSDIGCGMGAIKTSLKKHQIEDENIRKKLLHSFSRSIPVGFSHNTDKRRKELQLKYSEEYVYIEANSLSTQLMYPFGNIVDDFFGQLGTLGGGNHFLEVQYDENDDVWVMIHSGSRNIGKKIGDYFNEIAQTLNKAWYSSGDPEVPFLPTDLEIGESYLAYMKFALEFAYLNRKVMLDEVERCLQHEFPDIRFVTDKVVDDTVDGMINIHHNFASLENHMGKNYWVHRKGATKAYRGQTGIIPGSMGTFSYIVKGLGDMKSLMSCSHGAGRRMGRNEFCRQMKDKYDEVEKSLEGVVHSDFGTLKHGKNEGLKDVSECPGAYKDINEVMSNQIDLVEPIVTLKPLICMKG